LKLREHFSSVGSPTIRLDGRPKVTGETRYTADYILPGMIWGKCLRSPWSPAKQAYVNRENLAEWLGLDQKRIVFQVGSVGGDVNFGEANIEVGLREDGKAYILTTVPDTGTGAHTIFRQILDKSRRTAMTKPRLGWAALCVG